MDLEALRSAGLYDPTDPRADERRRLLEFLDSEGCTLEEMQIAHARGRLFALAGDRRIRPLVGLLSLREAAEKLEVEPAAMSRVWRTFGLPDLGPETPLLSSEDVEALRTVFDLRDMLGQDVAFGVARVVGAAIARITEAESSAMRMGMAALDVGISGDEAVTAEAFSTATALVPRIGKLLDSLHRHHLEATRVHFEGVDRDVEDRAAFRCGVGFADLSGFTRLSSQLNLAQLSQVLSIFEESATDTVHARGGRIVKFLGDAVMWVSADPEHLVQIACDLAAHPRAVAAGIEVRSGVAYGRVLAQDGDYFGTPVNLASRLAAVAAPGEVLGSADLVDVLGPSWQATRGEPTPLRGFEEPVTPYALTPR